jgi:hypothetical protein
MKKILIITIISLLVTPVLKSQNFTKTNNNNSFVRNDFIYYSDITNLLEGIDVELLEFVGYDSWKVIVMNRVGFIQNHHLIQTDYMKLAKEKYESQKAKEDCIKFFGNDDGLILFNILIKKGNKINMYMFNDLSVIKIHKN